MKRTIIPCLLILALFASYTLGQAARKPAPKNCCCEHVQEILEVLKRIEKNGLKEDNSDWTPPPDIQGFKDPGGLTMPDFDALPNISKPHKK